jgi:hypothetical protein
MNASRLKGWSLATSFAFLLVMGAGGWRGTTSSHATPAAQAERSTFHEVALPAAQQTHRVGPDLSDQRSRSSWTAFGLLGRILLLLCLAIAGTVLFAPRETTRGRLMLPVTLRGPPQLLVA